MNKKRLGAFSLASVIILSGTVYSKETIKGLISEKPETYVESISTIRKTVNYSKDINTNTISEDSKYFEDSEEKTEYIAILENSKVEKNTVSVNYVNNKKEENENKVQEIKVQAKEVKDDVELSSVSKEEVKTENVVEDSKKVEESKPEEKLESEVPVVSGNTLSDTDKEIVAPTIETDESKIIELPVKGYVTKNLNVRSSAVIDKNNIVGVLSVGSEVSGTESNGWVKITHEGKTAYISHDYISNKKVKVEDKQNEINEEPKVEEPKTQKPEVKEPIKTIEGWLTSNLNLREGQGTDTKVLTVIPKGTKVSGTESNGWVKVNYNSLTGYVAKSYISDKEIKVEEVKPEEPKQEENNNKDNVSTNSSINSIVNDAYKFLGYRYVYASADPSVGFDCSGLVYYLYRTHAGVTLNRSSRDQASNGYNVSRDNLKAGDLLFFSTFGGNRITHVGLYVGDGKMIHASTPSEGVIITDINTNYYVNNFITARRILD